MCGRFVSGAGIDEIAARFGVEEVVASDLGQRYNVAPSQPVYAVVAVRPPAAGGPTGTGGGGAAGGGAGGGGAGGRRVRRRLGVVRWGLVPSWAKDPSVGNRMINARAETVATAPAYRAALRRRRCVLPADAFYEWKSPAGAGTEPSPGRRPARIPHLVSRPGTGMLALAGLWEVWHDPADPGAEPLRSAVIVTAPANRALRAVHDRMPAVLDGPALDAWLDPGIEDPEVLVPLLSASPGGGWDIHRVSGLVNSVANDGPELVLAYEPA